MAPKKAEEPPPPAEPEVPMADWAIRVSAQVLEGLPEGGEDEPAGTGAVVALEAFGAEASSSPLDPAEGFRFPGEGEEDADFAVLATSYPAPPAGTKATPQAFLNTVVNTTVSVTVKVGGEVYGPAGAPLLSLLQGTLGQEEVELEKQINAEEQAEVDRQKEEHAEKWRELQEEDPEAPEPEPPAPPVMPVMRVAVKLATDAPLAPPEDFNDWNVLTVKMCMIGSLPTNLVPDLSEAAPGEVDNYPYDIKLHCLGQTWEGSSLIKPEIDPDDADEEVADDGAFLTTESFRDAMARVGYPHDADDLDDAFRFLDNNRTGRVNQGRFEELGALGAPASLKRMVAFRAFLLETYGDLDAAFERLDIKGDGTISHSEWAAGMKAAGCKYGSVILNEIFYALDTAGEGSLSLQELNGLHLFYGLMRLQSLDQVRKWMLRKFKTFSKAYRAFDENRSGSLSLQEFKGMMQDYGAPFPVEQIESVFRLIDVDYDAMLKEYEFENLEKLTMANFIKELGAFRQMLVGKYGEHIAVAYDKWMKKYDKDGKGKDKGLYSKHFKHAVDALKWAGSMDPRFVFTFLDEDGGGALGRKEFQLLQGFNVDAARGGIKRVKEFLKNAFGDMKSAFRFLVSEPSADFYDMCEEKLPRVSFGGAEPGVQRLYLGRRMQTHLHRTVAEQRGVWVYVQVEAKDPSDAERHRTAREFHGRSFLGLAALEPGCQGLRDRTTLAAVRLDSVDDDSDSDEQESVEGDADAEGDVEPPPATGRYERARTFLKYEVSLLRPLQALEPRDVPPFPAALVPEPPQEPPPPTPEEAFHLAVRKCVRFLGRSVQESPLHRADPSGRGAPGSRTLPDADALDAFLRQLQDGDGSGGATPFTRIMDTLAPAVKQVVAAERNIDPDRVPDVRGLCGTERDRFYSDLYADLVAKSNAALDQVLAEYEASRARPFWHFRDIQKGQEGYEEEANDVCAKLAVEAEVTGDVARAYELYERRLQLPLNERSEEVYYDFAKFVCRTKYVPAEQDDGSGPLGKAKELLLVALSLHGGIDHAMPQTIKFLAIVLLRLEMYDEAIALLVLDFDAMNFDRGTCFFLSLLYARQGNTEYANKYLALCRKPVHLFQGLGVFDKSVSFKQMKGVAQEELVRKYEAKGKECPPESDDEESDAQSEASGASELARLGVDPLEAVEGEEDEFGFINPKVFHPPVAVVDLGAVRAVEGVLDHGLSGLALFLLGAGNDQYGYLRPETLQAERVLLLQARALMLEKEYEKAVGVLGRVQDASGDRCQAMWVLLGKCLRELGRPADAVGAWEKAVAFLTPCEDAEVYVWLGSVYLEHEDWERARKYLVRSLDLQPTASAWYGAGVAAYRLGAYEEAYAALLQANAVDRERTAIWAWLCATALRLERGTLALQAARYVLVDDPDRFPEEAAWPSTWPAVLCDISEGFLALDLPAPAASAAKLSLGIGGDAHQGYYLLARAHADLGDRATACQELEVAVGLAYDSDDKYDYAEVGSDFAAAAHDIHLQQKIFNAVSAAETRVQRELEAAPEVEAS